MSDTLYEFAIYCDVDGRVSGYSHPELQGGGLFGKTAPTICPLGNTHTVLMTSIVNTFPSHETKIQEEDIPTQGYMEIQGYTFDVPSGSTGDITRFTIYNEEDINVYEVNILSEEEHKNDTYSVYVGPTSAAGYLTQSLSVGDTVAYIYSGSTPYFKKGFTLGISSGGTSTPVGRVSAIDTGTNALSLRNPSAYSAAAFSPIYCWATRATDLPMTSHPMILGNGKIGGSYLPKGTSVIFFYKNNTGLAKKFKVSTENTY